MSMKKLLDEAVKASAVADATVAAVSQLADMADERSEEAADALDALRGYIERAPKTAEAVLRDCVPASACLSTQVTVANCVLAELALENGGALPYIRREAAQQLMGAVEGKLQMLVDYKHSWDPTAFTGKVYIFTREELLAYTRDAVAAGIAQS